MSYPKDEFDKVGEDMPVGMHRPRPSKWKSVWPFLVILVVVPLLGWGVSYLLTSRGVIDESSVRVVTEGSTAQSAAPDTTQSSAQSDESNASQSAPEPQPAEPEPTEEPAPAEPEFKKNAAIAVLNGAGTPGLAAERVGVLIAEGFENTTAANASGWNSTVSVVYYGPEDMEATAREVARILGIDGVERTGDVGSDDIVVLLR